MSSSTCISLALIISGLAIIYALAIGGVFIFALVDTTLVGIFDIRSIDAAYFLRIACLIVGAGMLLRPQKWLNF